MLALSCLPSEHLEQAASGRVVPGFEECLTGLQQVQQAVPDAVGQVEAGDDQLEGRMQPVARAFDSRGILT